MPEFHTAFTAMLRGDDDAMTPWVAAADSYCLRVYRNTVFKALSDAVTSAYPSVGKCLPPEMFAALALGFARAEAPASPVLLDYGAGFTDWLSLTETGQAAPYLIDLARLDRWWTEAHLAADTDAATAETVAGWGPQDFADWAPGLIASARIAAFDDGTPSLWARLREADVPDELTLDEAPEAVLIWRPDEAVTWRVLRPAAYAFLRAIGDGAALPEAATAAARADPGADIAALFAEGLGLRVIAANMDHQGGRHG